MKTLAEVFFLCEPVSVFGCEYKANKRVYYARTPKISSTFSRLLVFDLALRLSDKVNTLVGIDVFWQKMNVKSWEQIVVTWEWIVVSWDWIAVTWESFVVWRNRSPIKRHEVGVRWEELAV